MMIDDAIHLKPWKMRSLLPLPLLLLLLLLISSFEGGSAASPKKDYYEILGIDRSATDQEVAAPHAF